MCRRRGLRSLRRPGPLERGAHQPIVPLARDEVLVHDGAGEEPELRRQHSPLMSPLVWDLALVGNYEDQWLLRALAVLPPAARFAEPATP